MAACCDVVPDGRLHSPAASAAYFDRLPSARSRRAHLPNIDKTCEVNQNGCTYQAAMRTFAKMPIWILVIMTRLQQGALCNTAICSSVHLRVCLMHLQLGS